MEHDKDGESPTHGLLNQPGLELRPFDEGKQVAPPNPAGLEVRPQGPGHGLIWSRDDEKMVNSEDNQNAHQSRRYCGVSARTFWFILVVLVLVVVAIAIGAGVGASKHSASSTAFPPPTITSPPPISTTTTSSASASPTLVNGGCINGTTYNSSNNTPFVEICNMDFTVGSNSNTTAADWNEINNVATFHGCMDACALDRSQGLVIDAVAGTCLSVSWISTPGNSFGSCYMKNATALIGSSNITDQMMYAVPTTNSGVQSAYIEGQ